MPSIDMYLDTTREFLHQVAALLPHLLLAIVILLVGWLVARLVRFMIEKALRAVNFNVLTQRAGTDHFLQQGGLRGDTTTLFGLLGLWVIIIASLMIALNSLGLGNVAELLERVELFAPKVVIAALIIIFGSYFARFVAQSVEGYFDGAQNADAELLGKVARNLIMAFVLLIALNQLEIGGEILQWAFLIILSGVVLALALAFGIGGRDWAAALLERWWPRHRKHDN